jgi:hypothetical protein
MQKIMWYGLTPTQTHLRISHPLFPLFLMLVLVLTKLSGQSRDGRCHTRIVNH